MGSAERRRREQAETRQKILDAARDLFVVNGYDETSMRSIADKIEYTPTAIYHHFESKEALLSDLCTEDFRALAEAFRRIGKVEDPIERLRRIGEAYVAFALEHPQQYQLMFMTVRLVGGKSTDKGDPGQDAYSFLIEAVKEAMDQGRFRQDLDDPEEVAQMFWGASHGVVSLHIAKHRDPWIDFRDTERTAAKACDALLRGLLR